MRVLILGVGDAFTRLHFGSSALIESGGERLLLDCPDPIHRVLHEATDRAGWSVDASNIYDVLLTHLHGDHCNGLESFGFARRMLRAGDQTIPRPRLHTSRPVADRLWPRLAPAMDGAPAQDPPRTLDDFYELRVIEPERESRIGPFSIRCRFTQHPIPTIGLMISDGEATLGWSGDTPFEPQHVEWLSGADLIVHESNRGAAHTPIESLESLPEALRGKIRLIHLPDDFDASSTDLEPLEAGQVLTLGEGR